MCLGPCAQGGGLARAPRAIQTQTVGQRAKRGGTGAEAERWRKILGVLTSIFFLYNTVLTIKRIIKIIWGKD